MMGQGLVVRVLPAQKDSAKAATFRWRSMLPAGRAAACEQPAWAGCAGGPGTRAEQDAPH